MLIFGFVCHLCVAWRSVQRSAVWNPLLMVRNRVVSVLFLTAYRSQAARLASQLQPGPPRSCRMADVQLRFLQRGLPVCKRAQTARYPQSSIFLVSITTWMLDTPLSRRRRRGWHVLQTSSTQLFAASGLSSATLQLNKVIL